MPYEVTCPTCGARLYIRDDAGDAALICPRCLNTVPHPGPTASPATSTAAPVSSITAQSPHAVPSVESEARAATSAGYFVALALTLLGMVGALLAWRHGMQVNRQGQQRFGDPTVWLCLLVGLEVVLTILLVLPIARRLVGRSANRTAGTIGCVLLLAPLAFVVVFLSVCSVCVAVGGF